jgi:putative selenate reductase
MDIESILSLGIEIHFNQRIDKERFEGLVKGSDYIFIATGASKSRPFAIDGADSPDVLDPMQFLNNVKSGLASKLGKNILVIGGGNTAMDAARTAKRLVGSEGKVRIVYRRTLKQMPANEEEIKEAMEESIDIIELANPLYINTIENKIHSLMCQKMRLGDKDASGRRIPVPILNSEFEILCDTIIPAVGQGTDLHFISAELLKTKQGEFETHVPNVFIGGDALNGGVSVIAAIGDGRRVAQIMIDRSEIEFKTKKESIRPQAGYRELMIRKSKRIKAIPLNKTNSGQRNNFNLILKPLSADETISEASRCLLCDELCNICTTVCPNLALYAYQANPFQLSGTDGKLKFVPNQKTQILHIADWCNECGNCNTFCPTSGAPYKDKPHLFMNKKAFSQADDAYYFIYTNEEQTLLYKKGSEIHSFAENPINYSYITKGFSAQIKKQSFEIQSIQYRNSGGKINLIKAIELKVILDGAKQFFGL